LEVANARYDAYLDATAVAVVGSRPGVRPALPADEVVERCLKCIGLRGYSLLGRNCEHFATWCRYGYGLPHIARHVILRI